MGLLFKNALIYLAATSVLLTALPASVLAKPTSHDARASDLDGREWRIASYFVESRQTWPYQEFGQKIDPYIAFKNGAVTGYSGCGLFSGSYQRSGENLTISAQWTDRTDKPCSVESKEDTKRILNALSFVQRIRTGECRNDALMLTDAHGLDQIMLAPKKTGSDLSEFRESIWHLNHIQGTGADLSSVVIVIHEQYISFNTPAYFIDIPFRYHLSGLEFSPASASGGSGNRESLPEHTYAQLFEATLHKITSYKTENNSLIIIGENQEPIMIFNPILDYSIENHKWRINKYRGDKTHRSDEEGLSEATEAADITLINGHVDGSSGCGGWFGFYKLHGKQLKLTVGSILHGYCSPEGSAQADRLVKSFSEELHIEEKGDQILLRDASGKAQILLVPY